MSDISLIREEAMERANYSCEWAYCTDRWLELAHIQAIGMGGSPKESLTLTM